MSTNNGLTERFLQHSKNFDGSVSRLPQSYPDATKKRMVNENTLKALAGGNVSTLDKMVTDILTRYPDQLSAYVIAHGEIPFKDKVKLGVQATLLRAGDVSKVAQQIDTTDEDALREIEGGEDADQDINAPDEYSSLTTDAQAAMKIAMDYLSDCHINGGGDGTLSSALSDVSVNAQSKSNSYDGEDYAEDSMSDYFPSSSPVTTGLATIPIDTGSINPLTGLPTIQAGPAPSSNTSGMVSSGTDFGSIFSGITSILGAITQTAQAASQAANSTSGAIGSIKNAASGIGAGSISQYISNNKGMIFLVFVVIVGIIFLAIYAAKKK